MIHLTISNLLYWIYTYIHIYIFGPSYSLFKNIEFLKETPSLNYYNNYIGRKSKRHDLYATPSMN